MADVGEETRVCYRIVPDTVPVKMEMDGDSIVAVQSVLPDSPESLLVSDNAVPNSPKSLAFSDNGLPDSPESLLVTYNGLPDSPESLLVTYNGLPDSPESLLVSDNALPNSPKSLAFSDNGLSDSPESLLVSYNGLPDSPESLLVSDNALPNSPESLVVLDNSMPDSPESLAIFDNALPYSPESLLVSDNALPNSPESLPASSDFLPLSPNYLPDLPEYQPDSPQSLPVSWASSPLPNVTVPASLDSRAPIKTGPLILHPPNTNASKFTLEPENLKLGKEALLVNGIPDWKLDSKSLTKDEKKGTEIDTMKISRSVWHHRTRIERSLFIFTLCAIIVIVALSITVGVWRNQRRRKDLDGLATCENQECVSIAADLLTSINHNLDPCDDFYEFSCQQWINRSSLVDDVTDRFSVLTTTLNQKLKELLDEDISKPPDHFLQARKFYKSCMDWGDRESEGVLDFISDLEDMGGGWPMIKGSSWDNTTFDYMKVLQNMLAMGFDNGILFSVALTNDYKNTSFLRIMVHQTLLGLPERDWFENDDAVELYKKTIQSYAILVGQFTNASEYGVSVDTIYDDASDAVELEKTIAQMMYSKEYVSENNNTYNLMTIAELDKLAPLTGNNSWLRLLNIYFPYNYKLTKKEVVLVTVPKFVQNLAELFRNLTSTVEGNRTLANYMFYRQVWEAAPYLNLNFKRTSYDFENYVTGKLSYPVQWEECLAQASAIFDFSLASIYIRKYFPPQKKEGIVNLVDRIKDELSVIINETSWMDNATQERAIEKLREISVMAVYPENVLNDTYCNLFFKPMKVTDSYYQNMKNGNVFLYNLQMTGLRERVDKDEWKYLPSSILESNAYYTAQSNSIFIPLGVAHMWFFNEEGPAYANYGRIGFVLGHEMSHAFDNAGAQMDGYGNWVDWWALETKQKFDHAKTCLVKLFNDMTYSIPNRNITIKLNGSKTLGENIADDIGIQEAYEAYKKVSDLEPQKKLPGVELTPNQLFWVNYASVWCEKDAESYYINLIKTNEHPPSKYRVNSPLRNNLNFIRDFDCKLQSNMNPTVEKCHVWGA